MKFTRINKMKFTTALAYKYIKTVFYFSTTYS